MATPDNAGLAHSPRTLEVVARTLRHEVGDLLQTVYSTVAILQDRVDGQGLERRLLTELKARAETCKNELDAVVDLVCPLPPSTTALDLAAVVGPQVAAFARRFPALKVRFETAGPSFVVADPRRLAQAGPLLLLASCQMAQSLVFVRVGPVAGSSEVEWAITDDGPGASPEQLSWLTEPFTTTHHAQFGLGLALACRIAHNQGGRVTADNLPQGGFRFGLVLPMAPGSPGGRSAG